MEQKTCHKLIYKLHSKQLRRAKWDLELDLYTAMRESPDCIVSLNDSQALRFIDEIRGISDITSKVNHIRGQIKAEKKMPRSKETKIRIKRLYQAMYDLQFQKDYLCVIMDSNADYDRANKGFRINGIEYRRLLGTNGGIKNSTIVYVSKDVYDPLKKKMDNGRDPTIPLVPAKLEAYQALLCSGSTPLPPPRGIIVVPDCITRFKEDVILINDDGDGEPSLTYEHDYEIEHNDSDGFGLMSPAYSKLVNGYISGNDQDTISGLNTRYAWTKGMIYTFDFERFAEEVAGNYIIQDVWGDPRDIREADVILTESMLKLWNCYASWEDYKKNCDENGYQFSAAKVTPDTLENVRDTNYQFLQDYNLSDDEIHELCQQTFNEINDVLGMDYRRSLSYMVGCGMTEDNASLTGYSAPIQALMIEPELINDQFIRRKIWNMIEKRTEMAKRGAIRINGNYAMISGDPYALCQSMFGLEVTGILKAGEVYHKYWIDKGSEEIVCFRAPMTCHNNIRKMRLQKTPEALLWYQYMTTVLIYNAWDSACEAMNGADKDGDTNMCTDNEILVRNTLNSPTIVCMQRKAEKKIVQEQDIVAANKLAFNDDIGVVTNHVTSMIERRSGFKPGSREFETLSYRIMCGQHYQQATIDRAKGVVAKAMPAAWYSYRDCIVRDGDDANTSATKDFNKSIVASEKPYFMMYVYPALKSKYNEYIKSNRYKAIRMFIDYDIRSIDDLRMYEPKTEEMINFLEHYERHMVVGNNPCVVNRMCWMAEKEFPSFSGLKSKKLAFDYEILKSDAVYSSKIYNEIYRLYLDFQRHFTDKLKDISSDKSEKYIDYDNKSAFFEWYKKECFEICSNEKELCNILLDICYQHEGSKSFVWEICGETIVDNLLNRNGNQFHYPMIVHGDAEFSFAGNQMKIGIKGVAR